MRWIIFLSLLFSCSGYRFTQQENPLSQYGIQSLSIPMFYNYSNLSEVSADFTRETYRLLTSFTGLKLISGYSEKSDAVLIGIIHSPEKITLTKKTGTLVVAEDKSPHAVGGSRSNFYIPATTEMLLSLQVIVIKKPTEEELALLRSGIGAQIKSTSKIIFNESLSIRSRFTREIFDGEGVSANATQNAGLQRKTLKNMATDAATQVRDMVLYAF